MPTYEGMQAYYRQFLSSDEEIEDLIQGWQDKRFGALIATNKRLIFVMGIFGKHIEDFPYDKITSIQYETGMVLGGKITIFASGNNATIEHRYLKPSRVREFCELVRARIATTQQHANDSKVIAHNSSATPATQDIVTQLQALAQLKEQGILTEEEFLIQKKRILGI